MRTSTLTRAVLAFLLGLVGSVALPLRASDVQINPTGPIFQVNSAPVLWAGTGNGTINNNYFFSPLYVSGAVCIYVYNNNTTNAHTFTAQLEYTGNPSSGGPGTSGNWGAYASSAVFTAPASPGIPAVLGASTSGAALISLNISGGGAHSGSPDTANVFIVQTTSGNCMLPGAVTTGTLSSANSGQAATIPIQVVSDSNSQAFNGSGGSTESTSANVIFQVLNTSSAHTVYLDKVYVSSAVAAVIDINLVAVAATGCSNVPVAANLKAQSVVAALATVNSNCTTNTGGSPALPLIQVEIAANSTVTIDLRGWIMPANVTSALIVYPNSSISGQTFASAQWYEK